MHQIIFELLCSDISALIKILDDIYKTLDNRESIFMCLLDISAAFDKVDHTILLERLDKALGICAEALKWFSSYLSDRQMKVKVASEHADPVKLSCSVPQGSWLGPRLYSDYTMPLGMLIRVFLLLFHGYADDNQILKATSLRPDH